MNTETEINISRARFQLRTAGLFFYDHESELEPGDDRKMLQTINMNDVWNWACADGEYVPDDQLTEVSRLFFHYGWCGVLYWVSELRSQCQSEFTDVNRKIEFVRNEERLRADAP